MEHFKENWKNQNPAGTSLLDRNALEKIYRNRSGKQKNLVMQYFWAAFTYHLIVYALLSHLIIRYWTDTELTLAGFAGLLMFIPFTWMLMNKYKRMAVAKPGNNGDAGAMLKDYLQHQHQLLQEFFRFKNRYEIFLVPLSCGLLTWIIFQLFLPGGVAGFPVAAILLFLLSAGACTLAIRAENRRNFMVPLKNYQEMIMEMEETAETR